MRHTRETNAKPYGRSAEGERAWLMASASAVEGGNRPPAL